MPFNEAQDNSNTPDLGSPVSAPPRVAAPDTQTAQPAPAAAGAPGVAATSPNRGLHHFIGSVLGALAGEPGPDYRVDASGRMIAIPAPPLSSAEKAKRIAANALIGLSAPTRPQASGLASGLVGLGAGFGAVRQALQQQDAEKKSDFERQQQDELHKMELARGNALIYSTFKHLHDEDVDRNEEYKTNSDIAKAFEDEGDQGFKVQRMNGSQLLAAFKEDPKQLLTEGKILPVGEQIVSGPDGKPVIDPQTGAPQYERLYAYVEGMNKGEIKLPQSFVDYVKKYGPYADISGAYDKLQEGQEVDARNFVRLHNAVLTGMKKVTEGWARPEAVETKDGIFQKNPVTGEMKPATQEQIDAYQKRKLDREKEQQEIRTSKSTEAKNLAEAAKAKQDAGTGGPGSNLVGQAYLDTLPVADRSEIQGIGEGRIVLSPMMMRSTKGQNLLKQVMQAYPDYDQTKATSYKKMREDFTSGKTSQGLNALNTALQHLGAFNSHVNAASVTPGIRFFNQLAGGDAAALNADRNALSDELGRAYKNGVVSEDEKDGWLKLLNASTVPEARRNVREVADLLHSKILSYKQQWVNGMPSGVVTPVPILSDAAQDAYGKIIGQPALNQPHAVVIGGKIVGYTTDGKTMTTVAPPGARPVGTAVQ